MINPDAALADSGGPGKFVPSVPALDGFGVAGLIAALAAVGAGLALRRRTRHF